MDEMINWVLGLPGMHSACVRAFNQMRRGEDGKLYEHRVWMIEIRWFSNQWHWKTIEADSLPLAQGKLVELLKITGFIK